MTCTHEVDNIAIGLKLDRASTAADIHAKTGDMPGMLRHEKEARRLREALSEVILQHRECPFV